ncbi:MAG: CBS domain-containing protein [Chloroflexi bacterium]|nr:CBS domain-containing protein [Chloroflexota bacterium]
MDKLVRDIMKIGVPTCDVNAKLDEIAKIMMRDGTDAVIVMDEEDGAIGVVSQSDLVRAYTRNWQLLTAKKIMTEKILCVDPTSSITAAANMMQDEKVHQVFIMHEHPGTGKPSAIVTMRAIVREMAGLPADRPLSPMQKARKK